MIAPLARFTLGAEGDGSLLGLRSKLGTPAAANDQSGRLSSGREAPRPRPPPAGRAERAESLAAPARSAGVRLPEKTMAADRAWGAERLSSGA